MRSIFYYCLAIIFFAGCKKETNSRVDIYLLKSFTTTINQATSPATISISNAVLADTPLVANDNIELYTQSTTTFKIRENIQPIIKDYEADKAFAVTVDNKAIYFGAFHPAYLNSIAFGVATIDPILLNTNELKIQFATIDENPNLVQLDRRNDSQITKSLEASGRLR